MKKCFKCGLTKEYSEFYKHKGMSDGFLGKCKDCTKKDTLNNKADYGLTEKGVIRVIYKTQRSNSKKRGHIMPSYSKSELKDFIYSNGYKDLYDEWVTSGFKSNLKPSIDRIDSLKPYSIDNIRLMTWGENRKRQATDILTGNGSSGRRCKGIRVVDKKTGSVNDYPSQASVDRCFGFSKGFTSSLMTRGKKEYGDLTIERIE